MFFDQARRQIGIPRERCGHDVAMFFELAAAQTLRLAFGYKSVSVELVKHDRPQAKQPLSLAGSHESFVKLSVALYPF
jgi:hypothetical protein